MNRRHLLLGLGAALAAPAVIRTPGLLMPVRSIEPVVYGIDYGRERIMNVALSKLGAGPPYPRSLLNVIPMTGDAGLYLALRTVNPRYTAEPEWEPGGYSRASVSWVSPGLIRLDRAPSEALT